MRIALATVLLALAARAQAKLDCSAPKKALPAMIKRSMSVGRNTVFEGAPAKVSGGYAAAKQIVFDGDEAMSLSVFVVPGKGPDELEPVGLFLSRMIVTDVVKERQFYRASLAGALVESAFLYDRFDENGQSLGTDMRRMAPHDPRAFAGFQKTLKDLCRVFASGAKSLQEQQLEVEEKLKAVRAKQEKLKR